MPLGTCGVELVAAAIMANRLSFSCTGVAGAIAPDEEKARKNQCKVTINRFLHGKNDDRQLLQQQARKDNRKEKLEVKKRRKVAKKKAKVSTAKFFDFSKKQADIRRYLTAATAATLTTHTPTTNTNTITTTTTLSPTSAPTGTTKWVTDKWAEAAIPPTPSPSMNKSSQGVY